MRSSALQVATLVALAVALFALPSGAAAVSTQPLKYVAHRGDYPDAPEGSMAAYRNAVARGSEIVKLDVHPSKDGVIVMSHDPSFKRTMGWDVKIADVTWSEICQHTYLFQDRQTDERAVSLPDVLKVVRGIPEFWIDFKHFDPDFCERVLGEFAKAGIDERRIMVATYTQEALRYLKTARPAMRRIGHIDFWGMDGKWSPSFARSKGVLYAPASEGEAYSREVADGILSYAEEMGLWGVNLDSNSRVVTRELVALLKKKGLWVSIALIHDAEKAKAFVGYGNDCVVTRDRRTVKPILDVTRSLDWCCGPNARIEGKFLIVDVPPGAEKSGGIATAEVDLSAWDGKPVGAEIVARGAHIARPLHWYNGLKFQFEYSDPVTGERSYPNTPGRLGDFPKQTIRVSDFADGTVRSGARLVLGLQETSGRVAFDLSTLRIGDPVPLWPITNRTLRCKYDGLSPKSRRGVMSPSHDAPPDLSSDDFDTLQSWGVTLIRYQMGRNWKAVKVTSDLGEYDRWLKTKLDHFDSFVLPEAVKRGMKVVLDLHEAPGLKNEFNEWNMLYDAALAEHFVETWRRIARRFKGRKGIYGYDLVNEPLQTAEAAPGCDFWTIQKRAAEAIREIDSDVPIIVESNGQDAPWAFGCLSPLDLSNVIYQVHMYTPLSFTHQGVIGKKGISSRAYPDESRGWNKDYLRAVLQPVRDFQMRHGAKIYCGEFSAVAWAPGAESYLRDCIDIFEEYGWDWTYHAFREWQGWSVEHQGSDGQTLVPAADTPRKRALLDGFGRDKTECSDCRPETWFHLIGGNASKEGLAADIAAIADAGIAGITLFHGGGDGSELWPGVTNAIPCMSEKWEDLIQFAERECHRRGLSFKMQNCPGWSMSGGPWINPGCAMRKLVCFEPGGKPDFDVDDDYHEIGEVDFPVVSENPSVVRSLTVPPPSKLNYNWCFDPRIRFEVWSKGRCAIMRDCPIGTWADTWGGPGLEMTFDVGLLPREGLELRTKSPRAIAPFEPVWSSAYRLDNWQAKAGRTLRRFEMSANATPIRADATKRLVFGHVNMKRRNHPAPSEATGWECDKMDSRGFEANFAGYIGRLLDAGVKIDGVLVDSWECGTQTWTWKMESEFERRAGYALRPWLPALFGHVLHSEAATEKFLLDWRNVCARLVEENYYGTIARLAKAHGMSVQYETAFGDVIPGDILRFWKYADEPMCEFWNPHDDDKGFVGSFDFKPILPCVSAAHVYRKRRVSAEALTSFDLTFDENFKDWKKVVDEHFARGVTHIVYNTFTHNPVIGGKPPSSSYGDAIGSPFLREQTWWPYLKLFSKYVERCGRELECGVPAVDILMYLGDDVNHKPSERDLLFGNRYKYDYVNNDVLMNALDVSDGRLVIGVLPGCSAQVGSARYRVLWIPSGAFLLPATKTRIKSLAGKGARVVYGDFVPDWPSPVAEKLGLEAAALRGWYQRRNGAEDVFFIVEKNGRSAFYHVNGDACSVFDPITGRECDMSEWRRSSHVCGKEIAVALHPAEHYPVRATKRIYMGEFLLTNKTGKVVLDIGKVRDWATVFVNGQKVSDLWCEPYACDIAPHVVRDGKNAIRVEVVSTWYNALVQDAKLPEAERQTWTKHGPKADAVFHDAGLVGPVRVFVSED